MKKKKLGFILSFVLVALIAVGALSGCNDDESPDGVINIGEGATVFKFEVTDNTGNVTAWNVSTNQKTVGAALLETELIKGDESDWGLMVSTVNGLLADYSVDLSWWAFYIDGEMAVTGVDTTDIEPGGTYAFVYTID